MKSKIKKLLFALAVVPFFMSCNNDDPSVGAATIHFDQSSPVSFVDGTLLVTGSVTSDEGTTMEYINVICVYGSAGQTNETAIAQMKDLSQESRHKYTFRFTQASPGIQDHLHDITSIKIVAKVRNGDESTKSLAVNQATTPDPALSAEKAFVWERTGGGVGTGLSDFGLEWRTNGDGKHAIVRKDNATKLVQLTAAQWSSIKTKAVLQDAVDKASGIDQYTGVSAEATKEYNDVLGVLHGGTYYFLNIKKGTVNNTPAGTIITINGNYKN